MDKVTMSVQEMAMQMGISLSKAYALTREMCIRDRINNAAKRRSGTCYNIS